jgi:ATP-binding cassette subfamily F protein 3
LLTATNIFVQYGDRVLLDHINLVIKNKDKVGLVGRNGAGKSTLLKILASEISPHEGTITMPAEGTMAFLHQEIEIEQDKTVIEETMTAFSALEELNALIESLNQEIATRTDYESQEYLDILQQFSDLNEQFALLKC